MTDSSTSILPIRTALCSFGMSGRLFHAPFISASPRFQLYAVWERSAQHAAQQYPGVVSCSTLEELLRLEEPELVVVNTPNYTHFDYTRQALLAGKHVLVEKPFTCTVAEADALLELAEKQQKTITVYQNRRWDSDFLLLQQVCQSGKLGRLVEAEFHFDRYNRQLSPKQHKERPGPGTGIHFDLGSHLIDQALLLFGLPQAVFADLAILRPESRVVDYMEILLYYPSLRVRLKAGYLVRDPVPSYVLHGTNGSLQKSRADIQEAALLKGERPGSSHWGEEDPGAAGRMLLSLPEGNEECILQAPAGNYGDLYEGIYHAIRNGAIVPVSGAQGREVIRVLEKAEQSAREGRVINYE